METFNGTNNGDYNFQSIQYVNHPIDLLPHFHLFSLKNIQRSIFHCYLLFDHLQRLDVENSNDLA